MNLLKARSESPFGEPHEQSLETNLAMADTRRMTELVRVIGTPSDEPAFVAYDRMLCVTSRLSRLFYANSHSVAPVSQPLCIETPKGRYAVAPIRSQIDLAYRVAFLPAGAHAHDQSQWLTNNADLKKQILDDAVAYGVLLGLQSEKTEIHRQWLTAVQARSALQPRIEWLQNHLRSLADEAGLHAAIALCERTAQTTLPSAVKAAIEHAEWWSEDAFWDLAHFTIHRDPQRLADALERVREVTPTQEAALDPAERQKVIDKLFEHYRAGDPLIGMREAFEELNYPAKKRLDAESVLDHTDHAPVTPDLAERVREAIDANRIPLYLLRLHARNAITTAKDAQFLIDGAQAHGDWITAHPMERTRG